MSPQSLRRMTLSLALVGSTGCEVGTAGSADVLPGHSRPVLQHDWPHPRELEFGASQFQPPDASATMVTLPTGLRAFIMPDSADAVVQVVAVLPLGTLRERPDETGAAAAIEDMLEQRLQASLPEDLVARTAIERSTTTLRLSMQTMAADWRTALDTLMNVLARPLDVAVAAAGGPLGGGRGERDGGGRGAAVAELQRALAADPPAKTVVRRDAAQSLAARHVTPHAVVIAIAGAVTRAQAESALRDVASGWTSPAVPVDPPRNATALTRKAASELLLLVDEPGTQASVAIGHPLRMVEPSDEAPLAVLAEVLNIRLNIATREMRGLTNRASLDLPRSRFDAGMLVVRASSRPESAAPILHFALDELLRIRTAEGVPTTDELEQVKGGLSLGSWQASLDGARATASTYALELVRWGSLERLHGWPAAVRAVTAAQVSEVARKYIEPDQMAAAVSGDLQLIQRARHPRWPLTLDELKPRLRPLAR
jgi:predicted Zn-dependent peptidase